MAASNVEGHFEGEEIFEHSNSSSFLNLKGGPIVCLLQLVVDVSWELGTKAERRAEMAEDSEQSMSSPFPGIGCVF